MVEMEGRGSFTTLNPFRGGIRRRFKKKLPNHILLTTKNLQFRGRIVAHEPLDFVIAATATTAYKPLSCCCKTGTCTGIHATTFVSGPNRCCYVIAPLLPGYSFLLIATLSYFYGLPHWKMHCG